MPPPPARSSPEPLLLLPAFTLAVIATLLRLALWPTATLTFNASLSQPSCGSRQGDRYILCPDQKESFAQQGLSLLPGLITEEEMLVIERIYTQYMKEGSSEIQGKDFCDMSKSFGKLYHHPCILLLNVKCQVVMSHLLLYFLFCCNVEVQHNI